MSGIFFLFLQNDVGARYGLADIRDETMIHEIKSNIDRISKADSVGATVRLYGDPIQSKEHRAVILAWINMPAHARKRVTG